jgi:hypothetical protein
VFGFITNELIVADRVLHEYTFANTNIRHLDEIDNSTNIDYIIFANTSRIFEYFYLANYSTRANKMYSIFANVCEYSWIFMDNINPYTPSMSYLLCA